MTTTMKSPVNATKRISNAFSLGVFSLLALSTMLIMLSRNVSPGSTVILTLISPESNFVPPVTPLISPPDSLITGADSPVIADSSTRPVPSIMSPSLGIISPSLTRTMSFFRSESAGTFSVVSSLVILFANASVLVCLSDCALALPLISASDSAKLANITVNHSHTLICRLNKKFPPVI